MILTKEIEMENIAYDTIVILNNPSNDGIQIGKKDYYEEEYDLNKFLDINFDEAEELCKVLENFSEEKENVEKALPTTIRLNFDSEFTVSISEMNCYYLFRYWNIQDIKQKELIKFTYYEIKEFISHIRSFVNEIKKENNEG